MKIIKYKDKDGRLLILIPSEEIVLKKYAPKDMTEKLWVLFEENDFENLISNIKKDGGWEKVE